MPVTYESKEALREKTVVYRCFLPHRLRTHRSRHSVVLSMPNTRFEYEVKITTIFGDVILLRFHQLHQAYEAVEEYFTDDNVKLDDNDMYMFSISRIRTT